MCSGRVGKQFLLYIWQPSNYSVTNWVIYIMNEERA